MSAFGAKRPWADRGANDRFSPSAPFPRTRGQFTFRPERRSLGAGAAFEVGCTMGTTATSLHVLSAVVGVEDRLPAEIEKAYRKLGYVRPKKAGGEGTKRVILAPDASGDWLSIYDSENDRIDSGELKRLAVDLTKKLGTVAILTSVDDSDSFEFIMFHMGKQVDAAVSDPEGHTGGLKMLKGKRRAQAWHSMFIGRDYRRAVMAGRQGTLLQGWEERLKAPPRSTTPFAEDTLGAWCTLAGLSPQNATTVSEEWVSRKDQSGIATLVFERAASKPTQAMAAPTGVSLAYYRSDDDCPYHRFFPASWPRSPGVSDKEQWAVVCSGGGIAGLRLCLRVEGPAPLKLERIFIRALPFYNGQVTSLTSLAEHEWLAPDPGAPCPPETTIEMPDFVAPAADPQSRRLILLILVIQATLPAEGEATLFPALETAAGVQPSPALPPLRLRALAPGWVPLVSRTDAPGTALREGILRLNTPSVWSGVAVLPSDGGPARQRARALAEGWLAQVSPEAGTIAVVHTEKHLSAGFNISKSTRTLPVAELTQDKLWPRLFDAEADYQTVTIGLACQGAPHPHVGITVQASLHRFGAALGAGTLSCALWLIDHQEVRRRIGAAAEAAAAVFEEWIGTVEPQQAWMARAAWIPEFNTYDDFMQTLYESAVSRDWHRADRPRRTPWLRFVAAKLWLDESFVEDLDTRQLETVAQLAQRGRVTALSLRPGRSLGELEAALAPILPRFSAGQPLRA